MTKKRLLAFVLALVMLLSVLPVTAMAEAVEPVPVQQTEEETPAPAPEEPKTEQPQQPEQPEQPQEPQQPEQPQPQLEAQGEENAPVVTAGNQVKTEVEFKAAFQPGATVSLGNDITLTEKYTVTRGSVTILGNGKTLTLTKDAGFVVGEGASLTLGNADATTTDLTIQGEGTDDSKKAASALITVKYQGFLTAYRTVMQDRYTDTDGAISAENDIKSIILQHCTIQNCKSSGDYGAFCIGGTNGANGSVVMQNCVIQKNEGLRGGGGRLKFNKGSLSLENTKFTENKGTRKDRICYGALYLHFNMTEFKGTIKNCEFTKNSSMGYGSGALSISTGAYGDFSNCLSLKGCNINSNKSPSVCGGLFLQSVGTNFDLSGNVICNNTMEIDGQPSQPVDIVLSKANEHSPLAAKLPTDTDMKNVKTADGKTVNAWKNMDVTTDENLTFVSYVEAPWQATLEENNSMSAFCAAHVSPTHTLNYEAGTTDNVHNMPSAQTTQQDGSATFTVSTKEPIRQGYNFTGWKIKNSSNTTVYQPGGAITVTGTTTLVAQWEVIPYQPVYVFVQTRHQLTEGKYEAMEVDAAAVARLGISYNRSKPWATIGVLQSDALPTNATKGQQATAEQWNAVLAAIKDNGNFSNLVQFNGDGYNGTKFNASKLSTETLNALKWGSLHYNNGTSLAYTADNVPGWKFDSYLDFVKVTFDYNGGIAPDGAPNSGDYAVGESIQLPTPTREGYTFKGWMANDKAAGTGSYAAKTDVTLKAQWEANQYDVTFDVNANGDKSAKVTPETKTVTFDAAYGELPTPTRDGYTFKGWYAVPKVTDNDKEVTAATVVTTAGPHTLYAHWEARKDTKYTVEHYQEKLDGTYELKETEKLTGTTDTTVNAVAKEYDHFTYDETVKGTKASGTVTGDGKLVLKLYYIRNSYTVTFQPNNGDAATTATVKYDDTVAKPTDPTKSGYTFGGWYTDKKCTKGNEFSFDTKITGDITLYAKWDIKRTGTNPDAKNPYIKDNTKKDDGKTVKSGDTFDAGIGLYVGMSLLSLTGSALVVTKKKRG